jgi:hypothetical protein
MIFSVSDFTMDQKSHNGNKERGFAPLTPEPNGRNNSMGAHDRIPPDPANSGHKCTVTFADGAFQNSPLRRDQEGPASGRSPSLHKRNLGRPPLLETPRRHPPTSLAEEEAAIDHRPEADLCEDLDRQEHHPRG